MTIWEGEDYTRVFSNLRPFNGRTFKHLAIQEALHLTVGLNPFAIDGELWDGASASASDNFAAPS